MQQARLEEENAKLASRELSKAKRIAEGDFLSLQCFYFFACYPIIYILIVVDVFFDIFSAEGKKLSEIPYKKPILSGVKNKYSPPVSASRNNVNVNKNDGNLVQSSPALKKANNVVKVDQRPTNWNRLVRKF